VEVDSKSFFALVAALAACNRDVGRSPPRVDASSDLQASRAESSAHATPSPASPGAHEVAKDAGRDETRDAIPDGASKDRAAPLLTWTNHEPPILEPPATAFSCEALARRNDHVLAFPTGKCDGYKGDVASTRDRAAGARSLSHYCHEGHGRWAIEILTAELDDPAWEAGGCGWASTYRFVFVPTSGDAAEPVRTASFEERSFGDETVELEPPVAFDYDGDGRDELLVATKHWGNGEGNSSSLSLLTSTGKPYPVGFAFDGIADGDGDGRPDLLDARHFSAEYGCGLGVHRVHGASLLVHALPDGTFSMSDDSSKAWALGECPSGSPKKDAECLEGASCMRLWGKSEEEITAWMKTHCQMECMAPDTAKQIAATPLPFPPLTTTATKTKAARHKVIAAPENVEAER
jgi:hypothetical protein